MFEIRAARLLEQSVKRQMKERQLNYKAANGSFKTILEYLAFIRRSKFNRCLIDALYPVINSINNKIRKNNIKYVRYITLNTKRHYLILLIYRVRQSYD